MNIQKTNMLLLDNKFKMKENAPAPVANPVSSESSAKNVMDALLAQGRQNYLNNNVAFQGGMKQKVAAYATAAILGLGALATTSCTKDRIVEDRQPVIVNVETNVTIDLSTLQALLAEIKAMHEDMNNKDAAYKEQLQQIIDMFQTFIDMYNNKTADDEKFKQEILNNQNVIITLLEMQGLNHDEAVKLLNKILNTNMSMEELLNIIKGLVSDIKSQLDTIIENQNDAAKDRKALLDYVAGIYVNTSTLVYIGEQALKNDSITNAQLKLLIQKVEAMNVDMNANSEKLAEQLGIQHQQLITLLNNMGYSINEIQKMTAAEIIGAIKENRAVAEASDAKLAEIIKLLKEGKLTAEEAAAKIIELLQNIDANVASILTTVNNLYQAYLDEAKKNDEFRMNMVVGMNLNNELLMNSNKLLTENNEILNNMSVKLDVTNDKLDSLIVLGNEKPDQLIEVINKAIINGDEIIEAIKNIHVDMDASEIIAAIKEFQNTYIKTEAEKIALQQENNNLLATYLPLLKGLSADNKDILAAMEALAKLIKENTEAVNNNTMSAAEASAKELEAQKEANELLKKLIEKADAILAKLDANAEAAQKYYNNMEAKFDAMAGMVDNLDARLNTIIAQMKVIIKQGEEMKPVVDEILAEIKNLETIAGKALTKDELDQVLNKYGDDLKVLLNSLHADTAADLEAIMENIKKGNDIKLQILEEIKKHAGDSEILKQIKEILETREFCHCTCTQGDIDNNEGILEEIQGITG